MKHLKSFYSLALLLMATLRFGYAQAPEMMVAHYIDVGQGQSILLEFPKGAVLIDAGGQKDMLNRVPDFLNQFFLRRADLHKTLNTVIITHQHIDHDQALRLVAKKYKILTYVDNGHHDPNSKGIQQVWMQKHVDSLHIKYEPVTFDQVTAGGNHKGINDAIVDAVGGSPTDPKIVIYSGAFAPGSVADDENNHSLVIKVSFGKASFLFMGDLEESGSDKVADYYASTPSALNADVLQVGHHGSTNATTDKWVKAVKPHLAIINVGHWDFGVHPGDSTAKPLTTYAFGHPDKAAIDILEQDIPDLRPQPIQEHLGLKGLNPHLPLVPPQFKVCSVTHNIYATGWNGNIAVTATADGRYKIVTDRQQ